jgi:hypothetical protein
VLIDRAAIHLSLLHFDKCLEKLLKGYVSFHLVSSNAGKLAMI